MARPTKLKYCKICGESDQSKFYKTAYGRCKKCHSNHVNKNNSKNNPKPWNRFDLSFDLCHSEQLRQWYL